MARYVKSWKECLTNGQVERLHHSFSEMLSMYVSTDHSECNVSIPYIQFAYNTSHQKTNGCPPFFLMYGRPRYSRSMQYAESNQQIVEVKAGEPGNQEE